MTIGSLIFDIGTNTAKLQQDVAKVNGQLDSVQSAAGRVAKALIGAFSIRQISNFVSETTTAFAEQEAAANSLTAALKAQGSFTPQLVGQYAALADQFQNTTAFADDLVMEMQGLLVQVGNVMPAKMEGALKAATDLAAGLGIDLRTATMLVGKAFAGETGTLTRYGIVIDATKLKTDAAGAVMEGINKKFGGQAQTQIQGYAGKMEQLNNRMNDAQESAGELIASGLLPMLNLFGKLPQSMQTTIGVVQSLSPNLETLAFALMAIGGPGKAIAIAITAFKSLAFLLTMPAGLVVAAVVAAIAIWQNWETIGPIVKGVYDAVKLWLVDKFAVVVKWIGEKVDMVTGFFKDMYESVVGKSYVPDMVDEIGDQMDRLDEEFVGPVQDATDAAKKAFVDLDAATTDYLSTLAMGGGIIAGYTAAWKSHLETLRFIQAVIDHVASALKALQAIMAKAATIGVTSFEGLTHAAEFFGVSMEAVFSAKGDARISATADVLAEIIRRFEEIQGAVETTRQKMEGLRSITPGLKVALEGVYNAKTPQEYADALRRVNSEVDIAIRKQQELDTALGRLKTSWEILGPTARAQHLGQWATEVSDAIDTVVENGADLNATIRLAGPELSAVVQAAKRSGTEIPAALRPVLQQAAALGVLFDESGKKIGSLEGYGVSFGSTFEETMGGVKDAMQDVVDVLEDIRDALMNIPNQRTIRINVEEKLIKSGSSMAAKNALGPGTIGESIVMHAGGPVGRMLQFAPRAHSGLAVGEVPIIAQRGEVMFSRANVAAMGGVGATESFRRGLGSGRGSVVNISTARLEAQMEALRKEQAAMREAFLGQQRQLPALTALAARDAMQQQARRR